MKISAISVQDSSSHGAT